MGSKAHKRGKFIAQATKKKQENISRCKNLEKEIKEKELHLSTHFSSDKFQDPCKLKYTLNDIYNKKADYALYRLKTNFYEGGEKTGKLLARQLKEKTFASTIPVIKQGDQQFFSAKDINNIFRLHYEKLYTSSIPPILHRRT